MGYVIALAGKGGTGKTTIAALIVRTLQEKKLGSVLAVDADPFSNLAQALGCPPAQSIGEILDEISRHPERVPSGMGKDHFIEYQVHAAIQEAEGFDVLTMGRPEGPGCYCYVNNALRNVMQKLIKDYDYIVIDNEAGLEHLSRRTTRVADALVVVSDATVVGLRAARRINELAQELDIKIRKRLLLLNRLEGAVDKTILQDMGLEHIGAIPMDAQISKASLDGNSLMHVSADTPGLITLQKIGETIWQKSSYRSGLA